MKVFNFLQVKLNNFDIKKSGWDWNRGDKAIFFFVMGRNELPIEEVRKGPPLSLKEHVKMFKKKNKKTYTKSGFIMAKVKVENPKIADNIKVLLNNPYVKERIKKVREIKLS